MAWPKGRPRKKPENESVTPEQPKRRWTMKSAPEGWDDIGIPAEESSDRFHIPREDFPEDMDLQWVTHTVMGMEMPQERRKFENRAWRPVHQEDFGGIFNGRWMPKDAPGEINQDGLVLMARPMHYSIAARAGELRRAREQVSIKEQAWRSGDINATGSREPSAVRSNKINRTYERIDVPE